MLDIKNLVVKVEDKVIIDDLSMTLEKGKRYAIMGPNGSGKSTLSKTIVGCPDFEVVSGDILLDGESILDLDVDERSLKGLFMAFQYPVEIPGVNNEQFLRMIYNVKQKALGKKEVDPLAFASLIDEKLSVLHMSETYLERAVNHGFSGGEKKRNEILQMLLLDPSYVILDETDSGLDIDALKTISAVVNSQKSPDKLFMIITHYQRLLSYIEPDVVHVMAKGKLICSDDKSLALKLEEKGYDWLLKKA
ncbi:MAG: Fe-S cluster assembly ATPase SufC [bacterium]